MRLKLLVIAVGSVAIIAGCGGTTSLLSGKQTSHPKSSPSIPAAPASTGASDTAPSSASAHAGKPASALGFPEVATKNTTRVPGATAVSNAAAVALAVFPSGAPGTHPTAVTLAPSDDWEAALAASSLMAPPFRAPLLLSGPGTLPTATSQALSMLAPAGDSFAGGAQVLRVGDPPSPGSLKVASIHGSDPFALAAAIDRFEAKARGGESLNVIVASAQAPAYAMPAAGYAAESGEPILFVNSDSIPAPTQAALLAHHHPRIYVLGPSTAVSDTVMAELRHYGTVKRVGTTGPAANSVAFAEYRDPACTYGQQCVHIPHSFGWAIRSPGHAYVLINDSDPLNAAAASALSSSGGYGPQLLIDDRNTLPKPVLDYFLNFATPGYTQEGPTAAVYNHGWLIGNTDAISFAVQSQVDKLLEVVPQT